MLVFLIRLILLAYLPAGPRYVFATEKSGFQSGFMVSYGGGVELNFSKKFGLTAFYENSANTSYYNLSLGLKF